MNFRKIDLSPIAFEFEGETATVEMTVNLEQVFLVAAGQGLTHDDIQKTRELQDELVKSNGALHLTPDLHRLLVKKLEQSLARQDTVKNWFLEFYNRIVDAPDVELDVVAN